MFMPVDILSTGNRITACVLLVVTIRVTYSTVGRLQYLGLIDSHNDKVRPKDCENYFKSSHVGLWC
jgi:hypothetical protein